MTIIKPTRRSFVAGAAALFCAPAIVRASSLMPVKAIPYASGGFIMAPLEPLSLIGERPCDGFLTPTEVRQMEDRFVINRALNDERIRKMLWDAMPPKLIGW